MHFQSDSGEGLKKRFVVKLRAMWLLITTDTYLVYTDQGIIGRCSDDDTDSLVATQIVAMRQLQDGE